MLFTFAFSLFSVNYGQVKIKERVEIEPSKQIFLNGLKKNTTHYLEYELIWTDAPCACESIRHNPNKVFPFTKNKYSFSKGIEKHEEHHVNAFRDNSIIIINNILRDIRKKEFPKNEFPCPEDIKNEKGNELIEKSAKNFSKDLGKWGASNSTEETDADKEAKPIYEKIKQNIRNWAEQQSWYNLDDPSCSNIF